MISIENFEMELLTMSKRVLPMHEISIIDTNRGRGLYLKDLNFTASPIFYITNLYKQYKKSEDINDIINLILSNVTSDDSKERNIELDKELKDIIENSVSLKECIYPVLVNIELNEDKLHTFKHIKWSKDIALLYIIKRQNFSIKITDDLFELINDKMGINDLELTEIAFKNLYQEKVYISSMHNFVACLMNDLEINDMLAVYRNDEKLLKNEMYIIRLKNSIIGSSVLLNFSILNEIAHNYNGDFIIIPSSTEELIICKPNVIDKRYIKDIEEMIKSINNEMVSEEQRLSDFPLIYSKERKIVMDIEDYFLN